MSQVVIVIEFAEPDGSIQHDKTCPYKHILLSERATKIDLLINGSPATNFWKLSRNISRDTSLLPGAAPPICELIAMSFRA